VCWFSVDVCEGAVWHLHEDGLGGDGGCHAGRMVLVFNEMVAQRGGVHEMPRAYATSAVVKMMKIPSKVFLQLVLTCVIAMTIVVAMAALIDGLVAILNLKIMLVCIFQ
jgi:hypothetical protein